SVYIITDCAWRKSPNRKYQKYFFETALDHMNINRASLFPDLDGAARYVNDLWEVNFDKAIGYIGRLSVI
ncbi:MAG TPA: hypothetical protein P5279_07850, partial [Anaerohalosphaeraceae bacterium]|nr:hypothetical protein [Anaerohalosphaeraceae bacterium]